jgi:hypothetical protein
VAESVVQGWIAAPTDCGKIDTNANSKHSAHFSQRQDIRSTVLKDKARHFTAKEILRLKISEAENRDGHEQFNQGEAGAARPRHRLFNLFLHFLFQLFAPPNCREMPEANQPAPRFRSNESHNSFKSSRINGRQNFIC